MEEEIKETKESEESEVKNDEPKINIKEMSEKDAKKMLKEVLAENTKLSSDLETAKKEAASNKESWYRVAADFDNFRKKNSETRMNAYREGKADTITKLLVVGDSLDRAVKLDLDEKTREGIELTIRQFNETLKSMDVTEINPEGEKFDPNTQEAIMTMPGAEGEEEGMVKQVFKKGYKLGDKIIRYAQVVIVGK